MDLTAEILSVPKRTGELIRAYAGEVLNMPPDRILVIATHTHAGPRPHFGPALHTAFGEPEFDERSLAAAVAYAADQAKKSYQMVQTGSASTQFPAYIANRSPGASSPAADGSGHRGGRWGVRRPPAPLLPRTRGDLRG